MSAADDTRPSADALAALLAEEAASSWLPAGAAASTTAVALGDLADTADLPRESLRPAAAPKRRVARLRSRQVTPPGRSPDELAERDAPAAAEISEPLDISAGELADNEQVAAAVEISEPADVAQIEPLADDEEDLWRPQRRGRGAEEHFELPRGPRPDAEETTAPLDLERGPRPEPVTAPPIKTSRAAAAARPKPAPAAPVLRVLEPEPAADIDELVTAQPRPLEELLEQLDAQEAAELAETPHSRRASVGEGEERVEAPDAEPAARRGRRVLLPVAVTATAIAVGGALAWPTPQPTTPLLPGGAEALDQAVRSATSRSADLLEQVAREARQAERKRAAARAAKQRAERARVAAKARRQRATRAAAQRRSAAPARTTTSAPVVAASAPRTSTSPTKRTARAPVCHSDLGPC